MYEAQHPPEDPMLQWHLDGIYDAEHDAPYMPMHGATLQQKNAYACGYLTIKPHCPNALLHVQLWKQYSTIQRDRPIRYEDDGNVLFNL